MKVLKFGGSSIGTPERIRNVKAIIDSEQPCVVVVSAFQYVTDLLKKCSELASVHDPAYIQVLDNINTRHNEICSALFSGDAVTEYPIRNGQSLFRAERDAQRNLSFTGIKQLFP